MLKVLVVSTVRLKKNGIATVIMNHYRQLRNRVQFDFVINREIDEDFREEIITNSSKVFICENRMKKPISYYRELKKIIDNGNYDIIHIHGNSTTMLLELLATNNQCKKIVHGHNVQTSHPYLNYLLYPLFNRCYDLGLVPSKEAGDFLFKNNSYEILNNSINTSTFKFNPIIRKKIRENFGWEGKKILLCIGNFNKQKRQSLLIDIFPSLLLENNSFHLVFIGYGELMNRYKIQCSKLNISEHVTFLESSNDIENLYSAADYFALPTNFESFGIVVLEAQVNGLPTIVSDTVPKEVNISGNVKFESNLNYKGWIEYFTGQERSNIDDVDLKKFDCKETSEKLLKKYDLLMKR